MGPFVKRHAVARLGVAMGRQEVFESLVVHQAAQGNPADGLPENPDDGHQGAVPSTGKASKTLHQEGDHQSLAVADGHGSNHGYT